MSYIGQQPDNIGNWEPLGTVVLCTDGCRPSKKSVSRLTRAKMAQGRVQANFNDGVPVSEFGTASVSRSGYE